MTMPLACWEVGSRWLQEMNMIENRRAGCRAWAEGHASKSRGGMPSVNSTDSANLECCQYREGADKDCEPQVRKEGVF